MNLKAHLSDTFSMACHECDLVQKIRIQPHAASVKCIRCGAVLHRLKPDSIERTLALATAGLILFVLANSFPFLAFKIEAQVRQTTLITGIRELYAQGMLSIAGLVFFTTLLVPALQLLCILYVVLPLKFGRIARRLPQIFRLMRSLQPWSMMEVFMLGILVSIVKLAKMAQIVPGIALFAFMALIFVLAAMMSSLDPHLIWEKWEKDGERF